MIHRYLLNYSYQQLIPQFIEDQIILQFFISSIFLKGYLSFWLKQAYWCFGSNIWMMKQLEAEFLFDRIHDLKSLALNCSDTFSYAMSSG